MNYKEAIEHLRPVADSTHLAGYGAALSKAIEALEVAETVVRCKDCIHWYDEEGVCLKIYSDGGVRPYAWQDRKSDDFCSYGERRADHAVEEH